MEYKDGVKLGKKKLENKDYERFVSERLGEYYNMREPNKREREGPSIDTNLLRLYRDSD